MTQTTGWLKLHNFGLSTTKSVAMAFTQGNNNKNWSKIKFGPEVIWTQKGQYLGVTIGSELK